MMVMRYLIPLLGTLALSSCATNIFSDSGSQVRSFGHYAVPKAIVKANFEITYPRSLLSGGDLSSETVSLKSESVEYISVPAYHLEAVYRPSIWSTDNISLHVDGNGFLEKVETESDEQSAALLLELFNVYKANTLRKSVSDLRPQSMLELNDNDLATEKFSVFIDPVLVSGEVSVKVIGGRFKFKMRGRNFEGTRYISQVGESMGDITRRAAAQCRGKICYPMRTSRLLEYQLGSAFEGAMVVSVPDYQNLAMIDFKRAFSVKSKVSASFSNGILSSLSTNKPSELSSVVTVPHEILKGIISLPTELIQLKVDLSGKQKEAVDAEASLIEAQIKLLEAVSNHSAAEQQSGIDKNAPNDG